LWLEVYTSLVSQPLKVAGQINLPKTSKFAAACDAYFYIHPESHDFLPLAVRPNAGSSLIYTPHDPPNDWLFAKMLFNINDFYFAQMYHFAATHEVVEITYQAAIRTLSDDHPVLAILGRSMFASNSTIKLPCH